MRIARPSIVDGRHSEPNSYIYNSPPRLLVVTVVRDSFLVVLFKKTYKDGRNEPFNPGSQLPSVGSASPAPAILVCRGGDRNMNTPFNQYNEVLDYFVIEGYQEGCIGITNEEPTDADLNWLSYNGELYGISERNPEFLSIPRYNRKE